MFCRVAIGSLSLGLAALSAVFTPRPAAACGGLFCDNPPPPPVDCFSCTPTLPVAQAGERIVFAREPNGSITAVIEIQYTGPADSFAWMIPVAGSPDVRVSSNAAFQRLQAATDPVYQLTTTVSGECREPDYDDNASAFDGRGAGAAAAPEPEHGAPEDVTVVNRGSVGPYDFVVIAIDPHAENLVSLATEWLQDNDFAISELGERSLLPYLEAGMNLLAFRLTSGNEVGSIRPVMLSFEPGLPSIPIRPTAVAAVPDMGVLVWVLGEHRAVPANYLSLEINEALVNWFNPLSNYADVVTAAANEAGGQGFVTEMSGPAPTIADSVFSEAEASAWETYRDAASWEGQEGATLRQLLFQFGALDGMRDVLEETLPLPEGTTVDAFLACGNCVLDFSQADIDGFDPATFVDAMRIQVIEPMQNTAELFDKTATATRLYTTMSSDEMTRDPMFDFNADLGEASRLHQADHIIECSPSVYMWEAPWRVELPSGEVVRGTQPYTWPLAPGDLPANRRVLRVGTSGPEAVVVDNTPAIVAALDTHEAGIATFSGGGCSVAPEAAGDVSLLILVGLLLWARRGKS